jgi:FkbM family methyltransferase
MTVVDIGANIGYFTILAARIVGEKGKVLAIEPDPHNFALLSKSICANGLRNVVALNMALGSAAGTARLFCSNVNFGDHRMYRDTTGDSRPSVDVSVDTLDHVLAGQKFGKVDFIKMDVQGYEHSVLNGMTETLTASPALRLLTEFWPLGIEQAGGSPSAFFRTLEAFDFRAAIPAHDTTLLPVQLEDVLQRITAKFEANSPDGAFVNLLFRKGVRGAS